MLTARQLVRHPVGQMGKPHKLKPLLHLGGDVGRRNAPFAQAESHVIAHAHMRPERVGLKHHADVPLPRVQRDDILAADQDTTLRPRTEPRDRAQQRGLARTGGAEKSEELPRFDVEIDPLENFGRAEGEVEILDRDTSFFHFRVPY